MVGRMKGVPTLIKTPFNTLGSVIDVELELDEEELLVETLRTFIVATSSETIMIEVKSFLTILKTLVWFTRLGDVSIDLLILRR